MNRPKRRMRAAVPNKSASPSESIRSSNPVRVIYICEKCRSIIKAVPRKFEGFSEAVREFLEESDYTE